MGKGSVEESSDLRSSAPGEGALAEQVEGRAAHAAARTKCAYLQAHYRRLAARRGKRRAAVAVGNTSLVIAYDLLRDGTDYHDLGHNFFDARDRRHVEHRLLRRLEGLGYEVKLTHIAADWLHTRSFSHQAGPLPRRAALGVA